MDFDFGKETDHISALQHTWEELRSDLQAKKYAYNDLDAVKQSTFIKVFSDAFVNHGLLSVLSVKLEKLRFDKKLNIVRAARLKDSNPVSVQRFIPDKKYITDDNRFSPPGIEWLYLSLGNTFDDAVEGAKKECRIKDDEYYGYCNFKLIPHVDSRKVIDLTIADQLGFDRVNSEYMSKLDKISEKKVYNALYNGIVPTKPYKGFYEATNKWFAYLYALILSQGLFNPISTDDKSLEYAPFQCIANYFRSLGLNGIIYKSTVYERSKNLVLFDKKFAKPVGDPVIIGPML